MREIKFRAWDKATGNWLEAITYTLHTSGRLLITPRNVELMQYTGLHDKNGKEIYEGDIVKCVDGNNATVSYHTSAAEFEPFGSGDYAEWGNGVEIIGNIYETPELVKKQEEEQT